MLKCIINNVKFQSDKCIIDIDFFEKYKVKSGCEQSYKMHLMSEILQPCLKTLRHYFFLWSAKRPGLALSAVILSCLVLLPFVTATALMPIVFLLDISNFVTTKGIVYVVYTVLFQGLVLGAMLVILFFAAFAIATSASVLHSYKYFYK